MRPGFTIPASSESTFDKRKFFGGITNIRLFLQSQICKSELDPIVVGNVIHV
jgi:hypothetical protein